jgi:hypothetical protein
MVVSENKARKPMDSKKINEELRKEIRPLLKERGFSKFTSRYAWRVHEDRVDVINFQSFNQDLARGVGCTTYSFAVNLGCYLHRLAEETGISAGQEEVPMPKEYQCQFRGRLTRNFDQPELARRDIWYVDPEGQYMPKIFHDVRTTLIREGFGWFDTFADESRILELLREKDQTDTLWGFGAPGSPARTSMIRKMANRRK